MMRTSATVAASLTNIMASSCFHAGHADEVLSSAAKSMRYHNGHVSGSGVGAVGLEEAKEYLRKVCRMVPDAPFDGRPLHTSLSSA